jgi:hypothetical protein
MYAPKKAGSVSMLEKLHENRNAYTKALKILNLSEEKCALGCAAN